MIKEITDMLEMLPEKEQEFACEVMRKLFLAWDSDYTKLTKKEAIELEEALLQSKNGDVYREDEIDWEHL